MYSNSKASSSVRLGWSQIISISKQIASDTEAARWSRNHTWKRTALRLGLLFLFCCLSYCLMDSSEIWFTVRFLVSHRQPLSHLCSLTHSLKRLVSHLTSTFTRPLLHHLALSFSSLTHERSPQEQALPLAFLLPASCGSLIILHLSRLDTRTLFIFPCFPQVLRPLTALCCLIGSIHYFTPGLT